MDEFYSLDDMTEPDLPWLDAIEKVRWILMLFCCINLFGFPTSAGPYVQAMCGFVAPAFYIISGFLVLQYEDVYKHRINRTIIRSFICFVILATVYVVANIVYGMMFDVNVFDWVSSKEAWFDFLVLNIWPFPIGESIWYVQALLYAYIIIWFLDKIKLLRFDYLIIFACLALAIISGELSGIVGFRFLWHDFIGGNFLTRALPYILIGGVIFRFYELLTNISMGIHYCLIIAGAILMVLEIIWLNIIGQYVYHGHFIGMLLLAPSICVLALCDPFQGFFSTVLHFMSSTTTNTIYYIAPIVNTIVLFFCSKLYDSTGFYLSSFSGIITLFISCFISAIVGFVLIKIQKGPNEIVEIR